MSDDDKAWDVNIAVHKLKTEANSAVLALRTPGGVDRALAALDKLRSAILDYEELALPDDARARKNGVLLRQRRSKP